MSGPDSAALASYRRAAQINRSQVNGWLWRARYAIRQGSSRRACEAMLSALWLLGTDPPHRVIEREG